MQNYFCRLFLAAKKTNPTSNSFTLLSQSLAFRSISGHLDIFTFFGASWIQVESDIMIFFDLVIFEIIVIWSTLLL